jgi:hypothetical protein
LDIQVVIVLASIIPPGIFAMEQQYQPPPPPPTYSAQRPPGRAHIPLYPKGFIAIRIVQLVLALFIIGFCAYGVSTLAFSGGSLMLFTGIATLTVTIWLIVAEFGAPMIYNYWAVIALDSSLVIFWLCSFALLAAQTSYVFDYYGGLRGAWLIYASCMAAAAALGGVELWVVLNSPLTLLFAAE